MAKGGYRPGAGRPPKKPKPTPALPRSEGQTGGPDDVAKMPLEYMLAVMNDPTADLTRRDRMAIASAPFVHAKIGDEASGKRDKDAAAAKEGASGRYEPPPPPRLVVNG